jgi:membrane fusion protein, heavy metal efflux system
MSHEPKSGAGTALPRDESLRSSIGGTVAAVGVVAVLVGFAVWGHRTEWRFRPTPRVADVRKESELLHLVAEPVAQGCALHGLARCPHCVADAAEIVGPPPKSTSKSHGRQFPSPPASLRRSMQLNATSAEAADELGVAVDPVWTAEVVDAVEAPGELQLDPRTVARISARVAGTAAAVKVKRGAEVKAGDLLALVESAEVGKLKADWLRAAVQAKLKRNLLRNLESAGSAAAERQRIEAEAALRDAETRLVAAEQAMVNLRLRPPATSGDETTTQLVERMRRLGLPADYPDRGSTNLLPIVAPQDGVLLSTDVVFGERIEPTKTLFVVADVRRLVALLHVASTDAHRIKRGQSVRFQSDGGPVADGKVESVATSAEETTRRFAVRVEIANPDGALRASTLGRGRITVRAAPDAVVVPSAAVVEVDGWPVAFVRDRSFLKEGGRTSFLLRPIHVGARDGGQIEILAGLVPGEVVATKGLALLKSEYLRQANEPSHSSKGDAR